MFKKENFLQSLLIIIILAVGALLLSLKWLRGALVVLIFIVLGILAIVWTIHALGSDKYGAIKRVIYFFLRLIITFSFWYGFIMMIKFLF